MSYLLPHLHSGFAVDQAILSVSRSSLNWPLCPDVPAFQKAWRVLVNGRRKSASW